MAVSRELSPKDLPSLQKRGSKNYISQADYIEFDGVKVAQNFVFLYFDINLLSGFEADYFSGGYSKW